MRHARTLLATFICAAFALSSPTVVAQAKTAVIKVGLNETLSGTLAANGIPPATAVKLAVHEINEKGIRVGNTTYRIELVEIDNRSEGAATIAGMTKLIEDDKVKFIFGPTVSFLANQAQELTVPAKVIHISAAGSWQSLGYLSDPKKPLLFGTQLPLATIAKIDISAMKQLGAKKIAFLSADDDTTKGNIGPFLAEAKNAGMTVTPILFPLKTTDFSSFVTRAKGDNAEAIYFLYPQASAPDLMRSVAELGAAPKGFGGRNITPAAALSLAVGKPVPFPFFASQGTPSFDYPPNAKVKAYADRMKATGANLGANANFSFFTYDYVHMLAAAISKAGTVEDTAKIAEAMAAMTYDGVAGKICFGKQVRTATYDGGLLTVRNGKVDSKAFPSDCK
jgi:branched-chain amino acid transport system substrate-binding protein